MAHSEAERRAMSRALELAARGPRSRNPQVGAVILSPGGEVLAEGWHRGAGTAHAEVDALSKLPEGGARGATAVVTLEPCNHTGLTGPCSEALLAAGVARVVYAIDDPGKTSGGGAERLRAAGVDVEAGVLADEAGAFLEPWITSFRLGRPHVTVKWAQSLDGRAAATDGTSQWITGAEARADVHRRRAEADAIVVGTGTLLADDPQLTARIDGRLAERQPVPVVIGTSRVPADAAVHRHPANEAVGGQPLVYPTHDLAAVLADLRDRGLHRVFVEGGPTLVSAFLRSGLADRLLVYVAPVLLGGPRLSLDDIGVGTIGDARRLVIDHTATLGDDVLFEARLRERRPWPGKEED
ncbi:bifunctional diaminohydroxyphosphoribosylaminopyrimidine deaminase/5-amino-6-(5-phosphoribosylamino)uracil reductase RibD [Microbacterium sediminis]|uniref:Riboflavin biosynthesis protein RibD n=1 Tax=Microbacterium sediminis TaxID=904291 RepID=A0A1B9NCE6_9MICO|nr:bifunctional diaminohydroxyphosphoribosylaminopyrimidine deaminase/5-amino-6-(5-phosphoribosylamino)uracil reductase RibD [Microbacterium sediminis]OCG74263.1 riboflavin biosynthesis protein RibD [Microbacterium sediminis]QBR73623.1 bifunctional diaminohydroxyphosphoribosylaminopyrimidine deaminase/5-amino-6-(5-phosphoribosylamino)uracil reductase RibD [Microbacterium sediminis]